MPLTLDDLLKLPNEITPDHVRALGLNPPPQPPVTAVIPAATVAPMTSRPQPNIGDAWKTGHSDLELTEAAEKARPTVKQMEPAKAEAPELGTGISTKGLPTTGVKVAPMVAPNLNFKERQALPTTSAGVAPGSSEFFANKIERLEDQRAHPWGTAENHPGIAGKIGHIAGRIGNIAGAALAPGVTALIPGSDLNRQMQESNATRELGEAQTREAENKLRGAQTENLESEIKAREGESHQELVRDPAGNVTGWKDQKGLHAIEEPETPQAIKDIASSEQKKPQFEKDKQGNIVSLTTDQNGQTKAQLIYEAKPEQKLETKEIVGKDGHIHTMVVDMNAKDANGNPGKLVNDLGRGKEDKTVSPAQEMQRELNDQKLVIATDKEGRQHLMTRGQAEADARFDKHHIAVANETDRKDAEQNTAVLNDMGVKVQNVYRSAATALKQGTAQRGIIATVLQHGPDSLISFGALKFATPETKEYIQDIASLRESALALPKQTTGGSRVSEEQAKALWNTIPGASTDKAGDASKQLRKFNENLVRLWRKVPNMEGQPQELVEIPEEKGEKTAPAEATATPAAGTPAIPSFADFKKNQAVKTIQP
jgi:hypothetical protein